ncbi:aspartate aminotransferase, putative [beta proteobacterium KB13]|uniref:Aminotransferase n=1 Tax=beta proteobacterium KB13 TaxID=314607 RepID=B6BTI2_9PROT|nr:aspartate aminotransferase, putative [beta proteobacterium KB13]
MTSKLSKLITQSEIRNMSIECDRLNGINLSQGVCDFPLSDILKTGVNDAINRNYNHYTSFDGLAELRKSISKKAKIFNNIDTDFKKNILVTSGATAAFYSACISLMEPGDEVIVFQPYYGYHCSTLLAANLKPVFAKLNPPDWKFDIEDLCDLISKKTKGIIICTPSNPCGKVFTKDELDTLADFAIDHNLIIFTDEIYEYFTYDGNTHISPGSIKKIDDRVVTISGFSKTYSITGWRIGYLVCRNEEWVKAIGYVHDLIYVCAPAPLQLAVSRAIDLLDDKFYRDLCKAYSKKREIICSSLKKSGLTPYIPDGAYYVLFDASNISGASSKEKAMNLLKLTRIATVPGDSFFNDQAGHNLLRLCFAKTDSVLNEASNLITKL